ncbi:formyltransferase family protein [Oceanimonas sp. GK1]|uniref:formyltransferase family protein n=1 Tax=Oceanimonas sp. (strain GK1 / IBRC-M 10197) TaxID=511062 RepID=UPI0002EC0F20|nr:ankyrin repeat domain-containing protein [Oceanimonas sp. GK1]
MLVLAGKNNIAVNVFNYLLDNYNEGFVVVCNQTDNGTHGWQRSLKKTALDKGVKEISLEEAYEQASIFISLEFDKIVRTEKFKKARPYNIHFSLLPKYKGMYTSIWPLLNNEVVSGVTLHEIDSGIDAGAIIDQREFAISAHDRARDLYRKYLSSSFELIKSRFDDILTGELSSITQPKNGSTYYSKKSIDFGSLKVDLNQTAFSVVRQIYSFSFREYQLPMIMGERIVEAEILDSRSICKPGTVVNREPDFFDLATIDFDIRLYFDRIDRINEFSTCTVEQAGMLLKGLCGVNDRNENGWSPIIIAAYHGNVDVVKFLLEKGASVNDCNNNGTSVLMYAKDFCIKAGDKKLFDFLVASGACVKHKDFSGKQLADYLSEKEKFFLGVK